jgi:hypothetical protein
MGTLGPRCARGRELCYAPDGDEPRAARTIPPRGTPWPCPLGQAAGRRAQLRLGEHTHRSVSRTWTCPRLRRDPLRDPLPTASSQGQPDLDVCCCLADGEPDGLETLHRATVPGLRIVKLHGVEEVERRDDAAAANDVEVRGHVARERRAPAQAWHGALCRFRASAWVTASRRSARGAASRFGSGLSGGAACRPGQGERRADRGRRELRPLVVRQARREREGGGSGSSRGTVARPIARHATAVSPTPHQPGARRGRLCGARSAPSRRSVAVSVTAVTAPSVALTKAAAGSAGTVSVVDGGGCRVPACRGPLRFRLGIVAVLEILA